MITNRPDAFESGLDGAAPWEWFGKSSIDGARGPWSEAPVGSHYVKKTSTQQERYRRVKTNAAAIGNRTDDWAQLMQCLSVTFTRAQMTDGGSTIGTIVLTEQIPIGAFIHQAVLVNVTGFTGDTSATIQVGDGTDVDRYSTGTPSVFTTANAIDLGVPSGTTSHVAAGTITITITSAADFTNVAAGQATLRIYYLN